MVNEYAVKFVIIHSKTLQNSTKTFSVRLSKLQFNFEHPIIQRVYVKNLGE